MLQNVKLLIYLLLVFLVLFVDGEIHISQKNPEILLIILLKRMMKVFLFLMKVLVAEFLMVWIPWSIPFSNILLALHLIFHLEFLICWIIWDVLLCLIIDGIKMFFFLEWCFCLHIYIYIYICVVHGMHFTKCLPFSLSSFFAIGT